MKSHLQVRIESHPFSTGDLIGGDAVLDFINTVTGAISRLATGWTATRAC